MQNRIFDILATLAVMILISGATAIAVLSLVGPPTSISIPRRTKTSTYNQRAISKGQDRPDDCSARPVALPGQMDYVQSGETNSNLKGELIPPPKDWKPWQGGADQPRPGDSPGTMDLVR